jgi:dCMP deaminase
MSIRIFAPPDFVPLPATAEDRRFMELAFYGGLWSKNLAHKVGCNIRDSSGRVLSMGFNGHASHIEDGDPRHWEKPARYANSDHAEVSSLLNARLNGLSVQGGTMTVNRFPCNGNRSEHVCKESCAQRAVEAGIGTVVVYSHPNDAMHPVHASSFREALHYLIDNGVAIRWFDPLDPEFEPRMRRKPDTALVPSGSIDWRARHADLARYISDWEPGGIGEVLVRRPFPGDPLARKDPLLSDRLGKIVRTMGCRTEASDRGAVAIAHELGVPTGDCALFVSAPPAESRLRSIADDGIREIVVPVSPANREWIGDNRHYAEGLGLKLSAVQPNLQPAPAVADTIEHAKQGAKATHAKKLRKFS